MPNKDILFLSFIHGVLEFLPVSSSFFLSKLFSNEYSLFLHGLCSIFTFIYFIPRIKEYLNVKFLSFSFMYVCFVGIHMIFGKKIWFLLLVIGFFCLSRLKKDFFYKYAMYLTIYILLLTLSFIVQMNSNIEIIIHFAFMILMLLSVIFNNNAQNFDLDLFDAFVLSGVTYVSNVFCVSRLGILMTYFMFRRINVKKSVSNAFIFSGMINAVCFAFVLINAFHKLPVTIEHCELPPANTWLFFAIGSAFAMPISFVIISFFEKFPLRMILFSVALRLCLLTTY